MEGRDGGLEQGRRRAGAGIALQQRPAADPAIEPQQAAPGAFVRTFPCTKCGAKLAFAPGTRSLQCEFCGTTNRFEADDARIEELDLETWLKALQEGDGPYAPEQVKCERCGAEQALPANHFASLCIQCGGPIVSKGYAGRKVKPRSLVPFQVDRTKAQGEFRRWVDGLKVAPAELRRFAQGDGALTGTYLPYWTYDCNTESSYEGERGTDHYELQDDPARFGQQTRVRTTEWAPVSGRVARFHDDVLVMACNSLAPSLRGAAMAWSLKSLVPYQAEYVSGYRAQAYEIGLAAGYTIAKETIDANVMTAIRSEIGGDQQRVSGVQTQYGDLRFKHVLLPVWVSAYRYRDKTYRFLINGQTGEVAGESPIVWASSKWIIIAVIVIMVVALILTLL